MGKTYKPFGILIIPTVATNNQPVHQSTGGFNIMKSYLWGGACLVNYSVVWQVVSVDYTNGGVST